MAHLVTGYAGHAHIKSEDAGAFNAALIGSGQYVMDTGNKFSGSIINNNTVRILDGEGIMYGRHFRIEPGSYEDMTIDTGTAGKNRIDLIVMEYSKNADDETESVQLKVIKGTETSGTASVPSYTDGDILDGASKNQMPLYKVALAGVVLSTITPLFSTIPSYSVTLSNCVKKTDVVDNLLSTAKDLPLSAKQGKMLNEKFSNRYCVETGTQTTSFGTLNYTKYNDGTCDWYGNVSATFPDSTITGTGGFYRSIASLDVSSFCSELIFGFCSFNKIGTITTLSFNTNNGNIELVKNSMTTKSGSTETVPIFFNGKHV